MFDRANRKWFWLGFLITCLVALAFLAIARAPSGRAQDGGEPVATSNREALEAAANADTLVGAEARQAEQLAPTAYGSPLVIPAADFVSDGVVPNGFRFIPNEGYMRGTNNTDTCIMAPAYLPNGATLTNMTATIYDNDTINRIIVVLYRANKNTGGTTTMASVSTTNSFTSGNPQDIGTNSISGSSVDTQNYAYYVTTCLPAATIHLYSVRLFYNP